MDDAPELAAESPRSGLRALAKAPYLQNLAALVFLGTLAAAIADYVFKAAAVESFGRGETLLRFFAIYYAGVSLLAFVVQATVSTLALERLGLGVTASTPSLALVARRSGRPARSRPAGCLDGARRRVGVPRLAVQDRLRDLLHAHRAAGQARGEVDHRRRLRSPGRCSGWSGGRRAAGDAVRRPLAADVARGRGVFGGCAIRRAAAEPRLHPHARTKPRQPRARFRPGGCHRSDHPHVDPQDAAVGRRVGRGAAAGARRGGRFRRVDRRSRSAGDPRSALARRRRASGRCCAKATACPRRSCRM